MRKAWVLAVGISLLAVCFFAGPVLAEVTVKDSGVFENTWYFQYGKGRMLRLKTGITEYAVAMHVLKDDLNAAPDQTRCKIGLFRDEVDRGWYGWGFINLFLNGNSIYDFPAKVITAESGPEKGVVAIQWDTAEALVTMEFSCVENGDNIFLEIKLEPKKPLTSIKSNLLCYPGDYESANPQNRERWIATAKRELRYRAEKVALSPEEEPWVFYYDKKIDPGTTGKKHHASCALLYAPKEPQSATVIVSAYSVETIFNYPSQTTAIHYVLWKFPGQANAKALEFMKNLSVGE